MNYLKLSLIIPQLTISINIAAVGIYSFIESIYGHNVLPMFYQCFPTNLTLLFYFSNKGSRSDWLPLPPVVPIHIRIGCSCFLSSAFMEDDRQLQTWLQWQTFLNVCPDWHHVLSVRQQCPCIPHLFTESVSWVFGVCLADFGFNKSACHCITCWNADIRL